MQHRWLLRNALFALLIVTQSAHAMTLAGVRIPERLNFGDMTLELNGAGIRSKLFVEVYVASLYLQTPSTKPVQVLMADVPLVITLHITSGLVTGKQLARAAERDIRHVTDGATEAIQPELDELMRLFAVEVGKGDVFKLAYLPDVGTHLIKNDQILGIIAGKSFKKALFGIWLSDRTPVEQLRERLFQGGAVEI